MSTIYTVVSVVPREPNSTVIVGVTIENTGVVVLLHQTLYRRDVLSFISSLGGRGEAWGDWRGGTPLSLARSGGPLLMSAGVCQNWAERGILMMGSYWSARSWHCVVAV